MTEGWPVYDYSDRVADHQHAASQQRNRPVRTLWFQRQFALTCYYYVQYILTPTSAFYVLRNNDVNLYCHYCVCFKLMIIRFWKCIIFDPIQKRLNFSRCRKWLLKIHCVGPTCIYFTARRHADTCYMPSPYPIWARCAWVCLKYIRVASFTLTVTWRHRSRDRTIRYIWFPIGVLLTLTQNRRSLERFNHFGAICA